MIAVVLTMWLFTVSGVEQKPPLNPAAISAFDAALAQGDLDAAEDILERYAVPETALRRLRGALRFKQGRTSEAILDLQAAATEAKGDRVIQLYLAAALVEGGRPKDALKLLPEDAEILKTDLAAGLIRGRALVATGDSAAAFVAYQRGAKRFADAPEFILETLVLTAQSGLQGEAVKQGERLLAMNTATPESLRLAAQALADLPAALALLEKISARLPQEASVVRALAIAYAGALAPRAAAQQFERVEMLAPGTAAQFAADQWSLAGNLTMALRANAQIRDAKTRLTQRVRLLFQAGEMARVVALQEVLVAESISVPAIQYQLAYAHYRLHQPAQAITLARTLKSTIYAASADALLEAMGAPSLTVLDDERSKR